MADSLFKKLDRRHPDYVDWKLEWERYRDMLGDDLVDKEKYLPRNKFEDESQYEFRVDISQLIPESALAIDRLLGALYKEKPKREMVTAGSTKELEAFVDSADRKGKSWNTVVEEIAFSLMGYGSTRVLVNIPPVDLPSTTADGSPAPEGGLTRAEEQKLPKMRPYVVNYGPLSIIDWEHDEDGVLTYCRIREERTVRASDDVAEKKSHLKEVKFIAYDQQTVTWWIFREDKSSEMKQFGAEEARVHGLGMVPMVVVELREVKPFIGHSFVRYSTRADVRKFQAESDLAYDTYMHAHPFLAIWTEDELKEIGLGSSTFLRLNPGMQGSSREDAQYIATPSTAFEALKQVIDENRLLIFRQAQVDPMGVISGQGQSSLHQASGVSRAWSFGTSEARILARIADRMQEVERHVFEIVLRFLDRTKDTEPDEKLFKGSIQYPEEFDLASTAQLLEERAQIGSLVNSPTLLRIIDKRIAASKVGDATAKDLSTIHTEIDDNPLIGTMAGRSTDPFALPAGGPGQLEEKPSGQGDQEPEEGEEDEGESAPPPGKSAEPTNRRQRKKRTPVISKK